MYWCWDSKSQIKDQTTVHSRNVIKDTQLEDGSQAAEFLNPGLQYVITYHAYIYIYNYAVEYAYSITYVCILYTYAHYEFLARPCTVPGRLWLGRWLSVLVRWLRVAPWGAVLIDLDHLAAGPPLPSIHGATLFV